EPEQPAAVGAFLPVPEAVPDDGVNSRVRETERVERGDALGRGAFLRVRFPDTQSGTMAADVQLQRLPRGQPVQFRSQPPEPDIVRQKHEGRLWHSRLAADQGSVEYFGESGRAALAVGFGQSCQIGRDAAEDERVGLLFDPHRDAGTRAAGPVADRDARLALAVFFDLTLRPGHDSRLAGPTQIQPPSSFTG